jgi:hypothetical protein
MLASIDKRRESDAVTAETRAKQRSVDWIPERRRIIKGNGESPHRTQTVNECSCNASN